MESCIRTPLSISVQALDHMTIKRPMICLRFEYYGPSNAIVLIDLEVNGDPSYII